MPNTRNIKREIVSQEICDLKLLKSEIISIVCDHFGLTIEDIQRENDKQTKGANDSNNVLARYLISYFIIVYCMSDEYEGARITNRHRSTIVRGVQIVDESTEISDPKMYSHKKVINNEILKFIGMDAEKLDSQQKLMAFKTKVISILNAKRNKLKARRCKHNNDLQRRDANILMLEYLRDDIDKIII